MFNTLLSLRKRSKNETYILNKLNIAKLEWWQVTGTATVITDCI